MESSSLYNYSTPHILKKAYVTSVTYLSQTKTKADFIKKKLQNFSCFFLFTKIIADHLPRHGNLQYIRFNLLLVANSCRRCCFSSVAGTCSPYNSTVYLPNGSPCSTGYCSGVRDVFLIFMHWCFNSV